MTARLPQAPHRIEGVDHIQLPIDPGGSAQARAFYEGLLGLVELRDPLLDRPGTLRFALGTHRLDLTEGHYSGVAPQAHLALRVRDLAGIARQLRAAGLPLDEAPLPSGEERLYVEDPFRNRLELIAQPHASHRAPDLAGLRFSV
ncbi:VOC family protein [Aquincola sp. MAHUQ-54]|uniref:VOC family protein n=1 Tax=Aquincola agrisoli TaxID=3119538 RepID=A0AAW9QB35_9BURK